jgi:TRAP transporter TAXI family solute receptor
MFIETYYDDRTTVPGSTGEPMIRRSILVLIVFFAWLIFVPSGIGGGLSEAIAQATGYKVHKPVLGGSCTICPWGAIADIVKEAVAPFGWDVQVCYNCAGAAQEVRLVEQKSFPPPYNPNGLTALGVPPNLVEVVEPPPPNGPIDFGVTTPNFLWWGYQGVNDFAGEGPKKDLRVVATILSPTFYVVAATLQSGITDLSQMKGKPIRLLWDRGLLGNQVDTILAYYGLSEASILAAGGTVTFPILPPAQQAPFDVIIYDGDLSGAPEFNALYRVSQLFDLNYIQLPDDLLNQLVNDWDFVRADIPPGYLRGIWTPIHTVAYLGNTVYGRTDMPDAFAYALAKALDKRKDLWAFGYEHFSYDPNQVWKAYGVPLHRGAERYYREKGYIRFNDDE